MEYCRNIRAVIMSPRRTAWAIGTHIASADRATRLSNNGSFRIARMA